LVSRARVFAACWSRVELSVIFSLIGWSASARLQFVCEVLGVKARARATVHAGRDGLLGEWGSEVNANAKHFPVKTKI
jgi:hypothetical protein